MANDSIQVWDGTPFTVLTGTATLVTGNYSTASTATVAELDNSTDKWPLAIATLEIPDTFSGAPTVGSSIDIYLCERDLAGGTTDVTVPTTTLQKGAQYRNSFGPIYAVDEDQPLQTIISLLGIRKCTFAIFNGSGASLSFSAGFTVKIEGLSFTPSA
jgi:hypothetical protein